MKNIFGIAALLLLLISKSNAQIDTTKAPLIRFTLNDGTQFFGRIESSEKCCLNILTSSQEKIKIQKETISELIRVEDLPKPLFKSTIIPTKIDTIYEKDYEDNNTHRMIIFPTARPLKTGEVYVQINQLFFPFAAIGFKELFVFGGGISLVPGKVEQTYYLSPKVTPFQ